MGKSESVRAVYFDEGGLKQAWDGVKERYDDRLATNSLYVLLASGYPNLLVGTRALQRDGSE